MRITLLEFILIHSLAFGMNVPTQKYEDELYLFVLSLLLRKQNCASDISM